MMMLPLDSSVVPNHTLERGHKSIHKSCIKVDCSPVGFECLDTRNAQPIHGYWQSSLFIVEHFAHWTNPSTTVSAHHGTTHRHAALDENGLHTKASLTNECMTTNMTDTMETDTMDKPKDKFPPQLITNTFIGHP
jgi:hypothetical protein